MLCLGSAGGTSLAGSKLNAAVTTNQSPQNAGQRGWYLHTNLGTSALMTMLASGATGAPAFNTTRAFTLTFPCAIQDCTTLRLCCGKRSAHSSSRRRFLVACSAQPASWEHSGGLNARRNGLWWAGKLPARAAECKAVHLHVLQAKGQSSRIVPW